MQNIILIICFSLLALDSDASGPPPLKRQRPDVERLQAELKEARKTIANLEAKLAAASALAAQRDAPRSVALPVQIPPRDPNSAKMTIRAPRTASVFIDGIQSMLPIAGVERIFITLPLTPDKEYFHNIRVEHEGRTATHRLAVWAGYHSQVEIYP